MGWQRRVGKRRQLRFQERLRRLRPAKPCRIWGVNTESCPYGIYETKTPCKPCRTVKYD